MTIYTISSENKHAFIFGMIVLIYMQSSTILAQETNIQEEATPSVTTSGARYSDDFNPEIHANFEVNY